jgi:cell division protein ZapE
VSFLARYRKSVATGALKPDAAQERAAARLQELSRALSRYRPGWRLFGGRGEPPRGLYIWGDVGRGKSMLMDLFFGEATIAAKRRIHFNAFMAETHARIHALRQEGGNDDPIPPVAATIAKEARLLCFDEFQVTDVADAMILGRLFEQLFERGVVVVATSNTAPDRLYEGGLNRQLFLPFIDLLKRRLEVLELDGPSDYRRLLIHAMNVYLTPLGPDADAAMDEDWRKLTGAGHGRPESLTVFGRKLDVPCAARGVARFTFDELCNRPLAAPDYLAIARAYHTVMVDRVPQMGPRMRDAARRFTLLIDTLYDESVRLVCSAAVPPEELYVEGDNAEAFRRTVSRLVEMQSKEYLARSGR